MKAEKNKNTFLRITQFLISLITVFSFNSCQKDDIIDEKPKAITITEKSFEELSNDFKFQKTFSTSFAKIKFNSNTESKTIMENQYGFTIANQNAKIVTNGAITSYTLLINREEQSSTYFENLVIQVDATNKISATIVKYTPTELIQHHEHHSFAFRGTKTITPITYNATAAKGGDQNAKESGGCITVETVLCNYGVSTHLAGSNCTQAYTVSSTFCWQDDAGGSGGSPAGGYVPISGGNDSAGGFGGGGYYNSGTAGASTNYGDTGYNNAENNPIVTAAVGPNLGSPEFILATQTGYFINGLPNNLKALAQSSSYSFVYPTIINYVTANGLTADTKEIIKNALINYEQVVNNLFSPNLTGDENVNLARWAFDYLLNTPHSHLSQQQIQIITSNEALMRYLSESVGNIEKSSFGIDLINEAKSEVNQHDINSLLNLTLKIEQNSDKLFEDDFITSLDPYVDIDFVSNPPGFSPNLFGAQYFLNYLKLRNINPGWSRAKCLYYASKDFIHLSLDAFGLIPIAGEVADLANGVLYTIEGDGLNASMSYASAAPILGWAVAGTKFGLKVVNVASDINSKVKLVWKVGSFGIEFGNRAQLRKVLGIVSSNIQAHHIIPWAKSLHPAIQKAAKSGNAFHMNEALNGIPLSTAIHSGSHHHYDNLVVGYLNSIPVNATPDQAYDAVENLINLIRTAIHNNPDVPINQLNF